VVREQIKPWMSLRARSGVVLSELAVAVSLGARGPLLSFPVGHDFSAETLTQFTPARARL